MSMKQGRTNNFLFDTISEFLLSDGPPYFHTDSLAFGHFKDQPLWRPVILYIIILTTSLCGAGYILRGSY